MIHRDQTCLDHLEGLKVYILGELNVKVLTLTTEDMEGVRLQGEPDSDKLGKRLKGEFKRVAPAIKNLTNHQLEQLQETGEIEILGHTLSRDEIKVGHWREISHFFQFTLGGRGGERAVILKKNYSLKGHMYTVQ